MVCSVCKSPCDTTTSYRDWRDGLCPSCVICVTKGNDLDNGYWKEVPDSQGFWWAVNPAFPREYMVAQVSYLGGLQNPPLRIHMAGERRDYPINHYKGVLLWQKAITPIFRWP